MTLQQIEAELRRIRDRHYAQDPAIRHDPLYIDLNVLLQKLSAAVDLAQDAVDAEAIKAWQLRRLLEPEMEGRLT